MTEWAIWFVVGMVGVVILFVGDAVVARRRTAKRLDCSLWPAPPINPAAYSAHNEPQQSPARSEPFEAIERLNISINGYHATADHSADGRVLLTWQPGTPDSVRVQMANKAQNHFRKTEHKA